MISQCRPNRLFWVSIATALAVAPAFGEDGSKFLFPEIRSQMQDVGYAFVCESLIGNQCLEFVSYEKYVGKKGTFVNPNKPVYRNGLVKIFELDVEGKRLYLQSQSKSNDPLADGSIQLRRYIDDLTIVGKPVVENSPVVVVSGSESSGVWVDGAKEPFAAEEWKGLQAILRAQQPDDHAQILTLLENAHPKYDDFEDIVRIRSRHNLSFSGETPVIEIQIYWSKENPQATVTVQYTGESWLFVSRYVLLANGQRYESPSADFQRGNGSKIREWRTVALDANQQDLVEAVIADSGAKIRFYGDQYYHDEEFGPITRRTLRDMLELWKLIG